MSAARVFSDQDKISNYRILRLVSTGGMGEVYEGWDEELQRRVALKVLNQKMAADPLQLAAFKDEGRALARLHHKNVVTVHTLGQHDGLHFIAMEFVNGEMIHRWVKGRKFDVRQTVGLFIQALEGLRVAHEAGVIHRDLKPQNIMVHTNGTVKIVDFGLSKIQTSTMLVRETMKQDWGTQEFTAPEVINGHAATRQSDIFSLGIVFKIVLGGNREGHKQLFELFDRMTNVIPPSRPQSVDEVIAALNAILRTDQNLNDATAPDDISDDSTVLLQPQVVAAPSQAPQITFSMVVYTAMFFAILIGVAVFASQYSLDQLREAAKQLLQRNVPKYKSGDLFVEAPNPPIGAKFKYLYKFDSADGGFTNELTREWQIAAVDGDTVEWMDENGNKEVFSKNPFILPMRTKLSALRHVDHTEYLTNPLTAFPMTSKSANAVELRDFLGGEPVVYTWHCWVTGSESLKTPAGTYAVKIVSCQAEGARQGVEVFKYAPALNHWVQWERHGFNLPNLSAELIQYSGPKP